MDFITIILLALILLALIAIFLKLRVLFPGFGTSKMLTSYGILDGKSQTKQHNLELILALFAKYPQLTNTIIRRELDFDDRVIVNYMDELEKQGKARQVGKTGARAYYELTR